MPGPGEEVEKNQKILLWLMEGQKEMVQHKRSPYGSAKRVEGARHRLPHTEQSCDFVFSGAPPGPRELLTTTDPASASGSGRDRRFRASARSGTTCCRLTRSFRIPPCLPTRPPAPSSSWRRCGGGWRRRRSNLGICSPSRGEWAGPLGATGPGPSYCSFVPQLRDGGHPEGSHRRQARSLPSAQRGARRVRRRALRVRVGSRRIVLSL